MRRSSVPSTVKVPVFGLHLIAVEKPLHRHRPDDLVIGALQQVGWQHRGRGEGPGALLALSRDRCEGEGGKRCKQARAKASQRFAHTPLTSKPRTTNCVSRGPRPSRDYIRNPSVAMPQYCSPPRSLNPCGVAKIPALTDAYALLSSPGADLAPDSTLAA